MSAFRVHPEDGVGDVYKTMCVQSNAYMADLIPESLYCISKSDGVLTCSGYVEGAFWIAEIVLRVNDKKLKPCAALDMPPWSCVTVF